MTFGTLVRTLLGRWYLTLPLLATAAYASVTIPPRLPVEYRTTAAVMLVGPEITQVRPTAPPGAQNRLLHLGDPLGTVSRLVVLTLDAESSRHGLAGAGLIDDYEVSTEADSPIIEFTVAGGRPELVESTVEALIASVEAELHDTQAELAVPASEQLILRRISSGNAPSPGLQSDRRSQALLLVAGGIVAIGLVVAVDAALRRTAPAPVRSRRAPTTGADTPTPSRPGLPAIAPEAGPAESVGERIGAS